MKKFSEQTIIQSITDALQFIAMYHPPDFVKAMAEAYEKETSAPAKNAMAQILRNSKMSAIGRRAVCQDTGIVVVFAKIGMQASIDSERDLQSIVDDAVRAAYTSEINPLRASIVANPVGERKNTRDNTPAVLHTQLVAGDNIEIFVAAKGGGSENKSKFAVLNPSDSVVDWVLEQLPKMGAGWCPPGIIGLGIGGSAEKAMVMAKESLLDPINMPELLAGSPQNREDEIRLELYNKINALGIGAQGLGGLTTVLDVKVKTAPTHAASLPVALIPNCAATRHAHFALKEDKPYEFKAPDLSLWPEVENDVTSSIKRVEIDSLTKADLAEFKVGDTLLLSGKVLTARDAAHKRIISMLEKGEPLPNGLSLDNRLVYYVGPVKARGDETVGPAGPTTANRMDKFTPFLLENTSMLGMIGKAERGPETVKSIKENKGIYFIAVGGAAYLISRSISASKVIAFEELGMEAVHEMEIKDFPVTVAVDSEGSSIHEQGPKKYRQPALV